MTAAELIARLQQFAPDTRVLVDGYEDGFDNINSFSHVQVVPGHGGICGEYDLSRASDAHRAEPALLLGRYKE